jgi:hypothetical protein
LIFDEGTESAEDILSELEKEINLEDIKSIQMTEKSCIVTLKSEIEEAKRTHPRFAD